MKKKIYPKKRLAEIIIQHNKDAFIPKEILLEDLDTIYKLRKMTKKIMKHGNYNKKLLKNMVITTKNVFGDNCFYLYNKIMTDEELEVLSKALSSVDN